MSQWLSMVTQALNGAMGVFAAVEYAREAYLASMTAALIGIFLVGYTKHMTKRQTEPEGPGTCVCGHDAPHDKQGCYFGWKDAGEPSCPCPRFTPRQPKHSADSPVEPLSHEPNGDDEVRVECLQCDEVFDGGAPFKCPNCGGDNPLDFSVVDRQTEGGA